MCECGLSVEQIAAYFLTEDGGRTQRVLLRRLRAEAPAHLCEGGTLFMECGAGQGGAVAKMFADAFDTEVFRDYDGNDRIVVAKLRRAQA